MRVEGIDSVVYREFFIPESFYPEDNNLPLRTILTTRGWQEMQGTIPNVISQARIYSPGLDISDLNNDHIKTNIKLHQIEYLRPFLGELLRLISAQAALEDVNTIYWVVSYPSAFSQMKLNFYGRTWQNLLKSLSGLSEQTHHINGKSHSQGRESDNPDIQSLRTKSIAFAQFFTDTLGRELVHTTCISLEGEISEISVWQDNQLVHQVSVPYGGRHLFHRILRNNLAFIGEIFGLSSREVESFRSSFQYCSDFNAVLDVYLGSNAEEILANGYVMSLNKNRNQEFRTLVAFGHWYRLARSYKRCNTRGSRN